MKPIIPVAILLGLIGAGCAHTPAGKAVAPEALFAEACGPVSPGASVKSVKGSVWLKAQSKQASGQFPANVEVKPDGDLAMEVTNVLGGTEASIRITGGRYQIKVPAKTEGGRRYKEYNEEGHYSWAGIPLLWASRLFLGKMPCPAAGAPRLETSAEGELIASLERELGRDPERFVYRFRSWEGKPWPESLHWERLGNMPVTVDFKFDDPEDKTRSPRKWEAKSDSGEVKMRWKDRELAN